MMEFDLSPPQSRILLAEPNHLGTLAYHLYFQMRFDKAELPWLERAAVAVISGNYGLRVRSGEGGYVQYYSDEPALIERINLTGRDRREIDDRLNGLRKSASRRCLTRRCTACT